MYKLISYELVQCITKKTMHAINEIKHWYVMENKTYIILFGATKGRHMLPKFICDKLNIQEVSY